MNKIEITKIVVTNLNGFAVGTATKTVFRTLVPHGSNAIVNIITDASILVAGFSVGSLLMKPVNKHTDEAIDKFFANTTVHKVTTL